MIPKKNPNIEVRRNSSLFFAIGLNIVLFITWQLLEYKTYEKENVTLGVLNLESELEEDIPIINMRNTPPPPPPPATTIENIKVVEDVVDIKETFIQSTESNQDDKIKDYFPVKVSDVAVGTMEEDVEVPFSSIEDAPVFPGCEDVSKSERKACFQRKIQKHINKFFRYPEANLKSDIQAKVSVAFIVDTKGNVIGIKSEGNNRVLEDEAERIMGLLPPMKPGKQRDKPVKVAYSVPILFKMKVH